jgi:hypothetical protein
MRPFVKNEERAMRGIVAAALAASVGFGWALAAHAGPCEKDIAEVQSAFDAALAAAAAAGPVATESSAATMHRQPTAASVAQAEERLGDLSQEKVAPFAEAITRARDAAGAGDEAACERAVDEARGALGHLGG